MGRRRRPRFSSRDDVITWWTKLASDMGPLERALVTGVFADSETVALNARLRREAIFLATRAMSREEVAAALHVGVSAIDKAIEVHNRTVRTSNEDKKEVQP